MYDLPANLNSTALTMEPAKKPKGNLATTTDGARYNKRQRPDNYSALLSKGPPPRPAAAPGPVSSPSTKIVPPHAHRADWSQWDKNSAASKKDEPTTKNSTSQDPKVATVQTVNRENAHNDNVRDDDDDDEQGNGIGNEEPGSPVDEPATHFGDFTPMRTTVYKSQPNLDEASHKKKNKTKDNDQRRDLLFGQFSAFPGLDTAASEKDGDPEALAYLQQVRSVQMLFILATAIHINLLETCTLLLPGQRSLLCFLLRAQATVRSRTDGEYTGTKQTVFHQLSDAPPLMALLISMKPVEAICAAAIPRAHTLLPPLA